MRTFRSRFRALVSVSLCVCVWSVIVGCSVSGRSAESEVAFGRADCNEPVGGRDGRQSRQELSQAVLDKAVKAGEPGCSAAVGRRGAILWTGVAGVSNLQGRDPITPDTVFDIGSVSKQFTATAVLLLEQDGKLSVNDRLSRHLDGLPGWADQVTLAQLMHHVSGIPETEDVLLDKGFDAPGSRHAEDAPKGHRRDQTPRLPARRAMGVHQPELSPARRRRRAAVRSAVRRPILDTGSS